MPTRARAAALTCFLGWGAEAVAGADDDAWERVHRRLHDWARVLRVEGVASLTETISLAERLPERILACADGERRLTDLRHVGQLLHAAAATEQLGTTALTAWLRRRIAEAAEDTSDEERSRRLESDAEAVQVLTIHRSKGLEFPVVYLPFLWEPGYIPREPHPVFFHDPQDEDALSVDVSLCGPDFAGHQDQNLLEQRGEDLRLAYVALTRAQHQAVVWWAGSWDARHSPLGRLLFARDETGNVAPSGAATPDDAAAVARFEALAGEAPPGCIGVERSRVGRPAMWAPVRGAPAALGAAGFDRTLDWRWRRTSYTDIAAGTYVGRTGGDARVGSEPEESVVSDEPASLLGGMPGGVDVGTLVHRVLEATDFAAMDLDAELARAVAAAQSRGPVGIGDPEAVVAGLRAAIETPLGPGVGDLRLRDVRREDRLDELGFELPLAGGDEPTGRLRLGAVAEVLRARLPKGDGLAGYAERLGDPGLRQTVGGYLNGSLDLVVRFAGEPGAGGGDGARFGVVDYKTNWLGPADQELRVWHYRPDALAAEMQRSHYGLQALLYAVALHRYLRWRVPGYAAERHLAGVAYLFVRGMVGPETPRVGGMPYGVFWWRPPAGVVEAISDVLDGRGDGRVGAEDRGDAAADPITGGGRVGGA
ncbi:MAG: hypothetical protein LC720_04745 [Actinobacteria bacterium]|nr:hypothetical protein [Actinomycetota bacterium]